METIRLAVYTREAIAGDYTEGLANSVHIAFQRGDAPYQALNRNYGILFPAAEIGEKNTIVEKGAVKPWIFRLPDGAFGIVAVRVAKGGLPDAESVGRLLFWRSEDLVQFSEGRLLELGIPRSVGAAAVIREEDGPALVWQDDRGVTWRNAIRFDGDALTLSPPEKTETFPEMSVVLPITGAIPGNEIPVSEEELEKLCAAWLPVVSTAVEVPEEVEAESADAVTRVRARVVYSDGSVHEKRVAWRTDEIDFGKPGVYEVTGEVLQKTYAFPLARGYADPVLFQWRGSWYFLATNDNMGQVGLYVREADTVDGLFAPDVEEHLILAYDEARGFKSTFWAPEFHLIGGELYILLALGSGGITPQCHMMRLRKNGAITDPDGWETPVRVRKKDGSFLADLGISLDMTYFEANGTGYLVWSYREWYDVDTGSMLYIAKTDPHRPWQLTSDPVLLSRPLFGWENLDGTINNEGPYPLLTDDKVYLAYSGGSAADYSYVVGWLKASLSADLLDSKNWEKSSAPALSYYAIPEEPGSGHNSFFKTEEGDTMIAYHAVLLSDGKKRSTGIRRVHFDRNGIPRLDLSAEADLAPALRPVTMRVKVSAAQ